jgi:hypothetical protein
LCFLRGRVSRRGAVRHETVKSRILITRRFPAEGIVCAVLCVLSRR